MGDGAFFANGFRYPVVWHVTIQVKKYLDFFCKKAVNNIVNKKGKPQI